MPSAEITTTVQYWPLRTRAEIDFAAWEIFDEMDGFTAHTVRGYTEGGQPDVRLQVVSPAAGVIVDAVMGQVIVVGPLGWEAITESEAQSRGLTLPAP